MFQIAGPRLQSGSAQISHVTAAADLKRPTRGVFLHRLHQTNPTTAVLPPMTLTSSVKAKNGPTKKKGEKANLFSDDTTQRRTGGFQRTAISIWPWGQRYRYNSLSCAPVLHSLKVRPRWWGEMVSLFFMTWIKSSFSPLLFSHLPRLQH